MNERISKLEGNYETLNLKHERLQKDLYQINFGELLMNALSFFIVIILLIV